MSSVFHRQPRVAEREQVPSIGLVGSTKPPRVDPAILRRVEEAVLSLPSLLLPEPERGDCAKTGVEAATIDAIEVAANSRKYRCCAGVWGTREE